MNGWTSKYSMTRPISRPSSGPTTSTATTASGIGQPACRVVATMTVDSATTDPTTEVDAAGEDDERHADGEDDQVGVVHQQVQEDLGGAGEVVAGDHDGEHHDEQHQRGERRQVAPRDPPRSRAVSKRGARSMAMLTMASLLSSPMR